MKISKGICRGRQALPPRALSDRCRTAALPKSHYSMGLRQTCFYSTGAPPHTILLQEVHMTKNTVTISAQGAASAGGKAALSGADILQAAQYDAHGRAGLPTLRSAFPQYRELAEVLQEIAASPEMTGAFRSLTPSRRQEFLDFCCGNRGVRVLYDSYFKYVFDPDVEAAALSRMISVLIGLDVKLVQILPNESHLGADYTLVIMDIIVEASDGSIVNVEVQKIGYISPGSGQPAIMRTCSCASTSGSVRNFPKMTVRRRMTETGKKTGKGKREHSATNTSDRYIPSYLWRPPQRNSTGSGRITSIPSPLFQIPA